MLAGKTFQTIFSIRTLALLAGVVLVLFLAACTPQEPVSEVVLPGSSETPGTEHDPGEIVRVEVIVVALLAVATVVNLVTERLRVPYTIGLVIIGLGLTLFVGSPVVSIEPELILALLLPPLMFEAAYSMPVAQLRRNLGHILTLAIPGVILTVVLVGVVVWLGAGVPLGYALVFGALIAPTDPAAVISLFRTLGVPRRLLSLLEGESLLNDGTGIVFFKLMLTLALAGQFDLARGALQFVLTAGGGVAVGVIAGGLVARLIRNLNNHLIETTFTTILAFGSYLLAEYLVGVSGVLAVAASGLAFNHFGRRHMTPGTQIAVFHFWEYAAFLANSFVFLLIGLQTDLATLLDNLWPIAWSILAVMAARAVVVYFLLRGSFPPWWRAILFWGGLRGAVSLALVLSLTSSVPLRAELQAMTFGVVLFTLVVQGLTITPLLKKTQLIQTNQARQVEERLKARMAALQAAQARLEVLYLEGDIPTKTLDTVRPVFAERLNWIAENSGEEVERKRRKRKGAMEKAWRESLQAQRSALMELYREHAISEEVYSELVAEVDEELVKQSGSV